MKKFILTIALLMSTSAMAADKMDYIVPPKADKRPDYTVGTVNNEDGTTVEGKKNNSDYFVGTPEAKPEEKKEGEEATVDADGKVKLPAVDVPSNVDVKVHHFNTNQGNPFADAVKPKQ